jgi:phosphatidylglycerol:prolipoprotein diacylglycerol transferase
MHPILFYVGPYPVFSYGVFITLGLITLYTIALVPARRAGWEWKHLLPVAAGVMVGGVFGARLLHLVVEPDRLVELLDFYSLFRPGTPGNIIGLMVGGYLGGLAVRESLELPSLGNYYAPALAAASVVWRVGCTLGGCCYGKEIGTGLPWAIHLAGADRHPTMIYEGLFNLALLCVLWRLRRRITGDNELLYLYLAAYTFFRFWLEFIRLYPPVALGLTGVQYICLGVLVWQGLRRWRRRAGRGTVFPLKRRAA